MRGGVRLSREPRARRTIVWVVEIPICTKRAAEGHLNGLTRSSNNHGHAFFLALLEILRNAWQASAIRVSIWWRTAGVAYPQLHGRAKHFASVM